VGDEPPEEDDDDAGDDAEVLGEETTKDSDIKAAKQRNAVLYGALNKDQESRYDVYRRVRLKKENVRRLTNHVLSQSCPQSVTTVVNGYTKVFIGEIIERAREVQLEWMVVAEALPTGEKITADMRVEDRIKKRDRGPLTPDHLREALRRYKKDREGGGAGFLGASFDGVQNMAARAGGRKLFH